ncbi:MAG: hypothetical protein WAO52_19230 [Prolixibacteraceae bacterium]
MNKEELDLILEKTFRKDPEYLLSANFAEKVTQAVARREQWKSDLLEYLFLTAVLFSLLLIVTVFFYFIDKEQVLKMISLVSGNIIPIVLTGLIINFIFFADRVLLRLLFNHWNKS